MSVDMKLLKELRAMTHAPLSDCKKALEASEWDLDGAQDWLRERWALKAAKNADRETHEWIVVIKNVWDLIVWLKLACETDFVAKNDTFKDLANQIVELVAWYGAVSDYESLDQDKKDELNKVLQDNFVTIGENMQIADVFTSTDNGYIYIHPGDKVAAVVYYDGDEEAAKQTALQIAAMNPTYLSVDDVPQVDKDTMKAEFEEELKDSGKPAEILENIIQWKMNKRYGEFVLLEQTSIFDDSKKVGDALGDTTVSGYVRYAI